MASAVDLKSIIVPSAADIDVRHQTNLGVAAYKLRGQYSPDTALWKSRILYIPFYEYPNNKGYGWDISRYHHHADITGALWTPDKYEFFDGLNDRANCGDIAQGFDGVNNKLTVIAWVNRLTVSAPSYILAKFNSDTSHRTFYLRLQADGNNRAGAYKDGATNNYFFYHTNTTPTDTVDTWYCVGATYDLANEIITHYVDGSLVASTKTTAGTPPIVFDDTAQLVEIGSINSGSSFGDDMYIGEVGMWTTLFSPGDMARFFESTEWRYS